MGWIRQSAEGQTEEEEMGLTRGSQGVVREMEEKPGRNTVPKVSGRQTSKRGWTVGSDAADG